jgi:hypothetical protein
VRAIKMEKDMTIVVQDKKHSWQGKGWNLSGKQL